MSSFFREQQCLMKRLPRREVKARRRRVARRRPLLQSAVSAAPLQQPIFTTEQSHVTPAELSSDEDNPNKSGEIDKTTL